MELSATRSSNNHASSHKTRKLSDNETAELKKFIAAKFESYVAKMGIKVNDLAKDVLIDRITEIMDSKIDLMIKRVLSEDEIQGLVRNIVIDELRQLVYGRVISLLLKTVFV